MCSSTVSCTKSASSCRLALGMMCPTSCLIPASTCFWLARDMISFSRCSWDGCLDQSKMSDPGKAVGGSIKSKNVSFDFAVGCTVPFVLSRKDVDATSGQCPSTRPARLGGGADWRQGQCLPPSMMRAALPETKEDARKRRLVDRQQILYRDEMQ